MAALTVAGLVLALVGAVAWWVSGESSQAVRERLSVTNGSAAVDLAVLDVVLPEMPGVSVFEEARRRRPALRFLFASGYSPGTTPFGSLEGLPASFLSKPYGIRELAAAVRRVLDAPVP